MFDSKTIREIGETAARLDLQPAALLAVADVESGGKAFARVNGRNEPLIRFEGHYFDRRLSGESAIRRRKPPDGRCCAARPRSTPVRRMNRRPGALAR